jgi:hypothetical protein
MKPLRWLRKPDPPDPPDQPNHYQKNDVETDKIVEQIDCTTCIYRPNPERRWK